MEQQQTRKLGQLNAYQIAALAMLVSTAAALVVVTFVRRFASRLGTGGENSGRAMMQPGVGLAPDTGTPRHFSENLIVPGVTESAAEISAQDARQGRSPEGA